MGNSLSLGAVNSNKVLTLVLLVLISTIKSISVKIIQSFTNTAYLHFGDIKSLINFAFLLKFSPF